MKEKTANYFLSHHNTLLFWRLNLFFIFYSAIYYIFLLLGSADTKRLASDILSPLGMISSLIIMGFSIRRMTKGTEKKAWTFFFISIALSSIASVAWRVNDIRFWGPPTMNTSMFDVLYFLAPVFLFVGIIAYLYRQSLSLSIQNVIDLSIAVIVAFILEWKYFLSPIVESTGYTLFEIVVKLFFPVTSMVCSLGFIFFIMTLRKVAPISLILTYVTFSTIVWNAANQIYTFKYIGNTYTSGSLVDPLWPISGLAFAIACYLTSVKSITTFFQTKLSGAFPIQTLFTYLLVVVFVGFVVSQSTLNSLVIGMILTLCLMIVRQVVSILDNNSLLRSLENTNQELNHHKEVLEKAMTQLQQAHQEAEQQAKTDFLTSLYNRRYINRILECLFQNASHNGQPFCVVLLDLDHFKMINDRYGHDFGDQVLVEIADLLRKNVRTQDTIGRYGGEEFIILLPDTYVNEYKQVAERIRVSIAEHKITTKNDTNVRVSASIGITQWRKNDDLHSIIVRADHSLYNAKGQGRNRVVAD